MPTQKPQIPQGEYKIAIYQTNTATTPLTQKQIHLIQMPFNLTFYHHDHLGTTRYITNENGEILHTTDTLAYGEELTAPYENDKDEVLNTITYTGHEKDYETDLTYMLARYYSQGYGRFLSPDPGYDYDQLDPMSWNLYAYVRGNPIAFVDPFGLELTNEQKARLQHLQNAGILKDWREFSKLLNNTVSEIDVNDKESADSAIAALYATHLNKLVDWEVVAKKNPALYQYIIAYKNSENIEGYVKGLEKIKHFMNKANLGSSFLEFSEKQLLKKIGGSAGFFTAGMSMWISAFQYSLTGDDAYMKEAALNAVLLYSSKKFVPKSDFESLGNGIYWSEKYFKFMLEGEKNLIFLRNKSIESFFIYANYKIGDIK